MKQSHLFTKTRKEAPSDEVSKNAQLLIRAGYVHKEMAGVYSFLPLGLRVYNKLCTIIRNELNAAGAHEMIMTALQQKDIWVASDRWDEAKVDDWFKTELKSGGDLGLAFTHEEPITAIMKSYISSYKDLPVYAYQFQTKFRNEKRAKSGVMRGREFVMKDLYDFSLNKEQHDAFYEKMKGVYASIFAKAGIGERTYLTMSSGGSFSKYSYEFQTLTDAGEDVILYDEAKRIAINKDDYSDDIFVDHGWNKHDFNFKEGTSVEVGDIYSLGEKFSRALGLTYKDQNGAEQYVYMGSYGIGLPRLMGTIVEVHADDKGIVWPESVAPFAVHLVEVGNGDESIRAMADSIYEGLTRAGVEVLYDDRDARAGEKFADSDLLGIPYRIIVGKKSTNDAIEVIHRKTGQSTVLPMSAILEGGYAFQST